MYPRVFCWVDIAMLWALALLGLVPAAFTLGDKDSEDSSETTDDVERLGAGSFGAEVDGSDGGDSPLDYAFPGRLCSADHRRRRCCKWRCECSFPKRPRFA